MTIDRDNIIFYPGIRKSDEVWGLSISSAGKQTILPDSAYPLNLHPKGYLFSTQKGRILDEYQLVYIVKGGGSFSSVSAGDKKLSAGSMIFLFPGEWHTYCPDKNSGWEEYWVGFKGEFADRLMEQKSFSKSEAIYDIGISTGIISLYEEIFSILQSEKPGYLQLISGIILHILGSIYYKEKNRSYTARHSIDKINEARMLMKDSECRMSPEEIAASIGIGYSKFRKLFKEYTGLPPTQYRLQQKLSKAKELLSSSSMNISEIAYTLKFDSLSQFSLFFKKREGISPREFRERTFDFP